MPAMAANPTTRAPHDPHAQNNKPLRHLKRLSLSAASAPTSPSPFTTAIPFNESPCASPSLSASRLAHARRHEPSPSNGDPFSPTTLVAFPPVSPAVAAAASPLFRSASSSSRRRSVQYPGVNSPTSFGHSRRGSSISYRRSLEDDDCPRSGPGGSMSRANERVDPTTGSVPGTPVAELGGEGRDSFDSSGRRSRPSSLQVLPPVCESEEGDRPRDVDCKATLSQSIQEGELPSPAPVTWVEQHADLLTFIAKKERKCLDLRQELTRHESELEALKKKYQSIVSRSLVSSSHPSGSGGLPQPLGSMAASSPSASASVFSTLTSLSRVNPVASAKRRSFGSLAADASSPFLLSSAEGFFGTHVTDSGACTAPPARTHLGGEGERSEAPGAGQGVQQAAKKWVGGIGKGILEFLNDASVPHGSGAPCASLDYPGLGLGVAREDGEPDQGRGTRAESGAATATSSKGRHQRLRDGSLSSAASYATADVSSDSDGGRTEASLVTTVEDGHPACAPCVPASAARTGSAYGGGAEGGGGEVQDTWWAQTTEGESRMPSPLGRSAGFPGLGSPAIGARPSTVVDRSASLPSPLSTSSFPPSPLGRHQPTDVHAGRKPNPETSAAATTVASKHGRRSSTLEGVWSSVGGMGTGWGGSLLGKKLNELTATDAFKSSKRATMTFVEGFERTLTDAITIDTQQHQHQAHHGSPPTRLSPQPLSASTVRPSPSSAFGEAEDPLPQGLGAPGSDLAPAPASSSSPARKPVLRGAWGRTPTVAASASLLDEADEGLAAAALSPSLVPSAGQTEGRKKRGKPSGAAAVTAVHEEDEDWGW